MFFASSVLSVILTFTSGVAAEILPGDHILWGRGGTPTSLVKRAVASTSAAPSSTLVADGSCKNGAFTRSCWGNGYSISADFDHKWPTTGVTRTYNFEVTNTTCAPDGISRDCLLVNGQYPGPVVTANWGDTIIVNLKNSALHNGTGLHWHGVRQLNTNDMDGANGLTECPLAPGDTKTYKFQATQVSC
jgi:multicopper oxidase